MKRVGFALTVAVDERGAGWCLQQVWHVLVSELAGAADDWSVVAESAVSGRCWGDDLGAFALHRVPLEPADHGAARVGAAHAVGRVRSRARAQLGCGCCIAC